MNTIALVIPYFGKFNNYFHLWMESAKRNVTVEFHIYTDPLLSTKSCGRS